MKDAGRGVLSGALQRLFGKLRNIRLAGEHINGNEVTKSLAFQACLVCLSRDPLASVDNLVWRV